MYFRAKSNYPWKLPWWSLLRKWKFMNRIWVKVSAIGFRPGLDFQWLLANIIVCVFRVFYEKMMWLWNPVLRFKSRYPFWTKTSILLKTGTWTFCWTYQSQFEANIWSLILLIRPRKHPSNWKFSKIKLLWWVFKRVFKKETFFEKIEFFEILESFFEILESFFEILESFFGINWEFPDAESFLLA